VTACDDVHGAVNCLGAILFLCNACTSLAHRRRSNLVPPCVFSLAQMLPQNTTTGAPSSSAAYSSADQPTGAGYMAGGSAGGMGGGMGHQPVGTTPALAPDNGPNVPAGLVMKATVCIVALCLLFQIIAMATPQWMYVDLSPRCLRWDSTSDTVSLCSCARSVYGVQGLQVQTGLFQSCVPDPYSQNNMLCTQISDNPCNGDDVCARIKAAEAFGLFSLFSLAGSLGGLLYGLWRPGSGRVQKWAILSILLAAFWSMLTFSLFTSGLWQTYISTYNSRTCRGVGPCRPLLS
jgi:hypothetical protein